MLHMKRHPLREDVSWNTTYTMGQYLLDVVILFVRMWVEICSYSIHAWKLSVILFVRMWVEIFLTLTTPNHAYVILFVRMWVEIIAISVIFLPCTRHPLREDVSWNGNSYDLNDKENGHPLREDVSWNGNSYDLNAKENGHPLREDVSWNKFYIHRI